MEIAATRPTKAPVMTHAFNPLPLVDEPVGEVVGGTPEPVHLGVAPGGSSLVAFTNRIGWPSSVPGPASGVPKKEVRRRKEEEWTEERILTTDSISFESVPSDLNLDSAVSALRKKKPYKPTVTSMRAQ